MSGHSKWSKIKHQKASADSKKGKIFSNVSRLITLAAQKGADPDKNADLRYAISQAKSINMPSINIERAIERGAGGRQGKETEEILYEAFGPGGSAMLIRGLTDNKNRTSSEIKHLLSKNNLKLAAPGSALWAFEKNKEGEWKPKALINITDSEKERLRKLIGDLREHNDVQGVYVNVTGFMLQVS